MARVYTSTPPDVRFWRYVQVTGVCWEWTGALDRDGYGAFYVRRDGSKKIMAKPHRWSYEHLVAPIPPGFQIDHLCRNRKCCNPDHLEPVAPQVNLLRAPSCRSTIARRATHCPAGHPYEGDNLYVDPVGHRHCRTCKRDRRRLAAKDVKS